MKDRNLFRFVNTIGNIFTRGCATRENIADGVLFAEKSSMYLLVHVFWSVQSVQLQWNALDNNVVSAPSVNSFKNRLNNQWKKAPLNSLQVATTVWTTKCCIYKKPKGPLEAVGLPVVKGT